MKRMLKYLCLLLGLTTTVLASTNDYSQWPYAEVHQQAVEGSAEAQHYLAEEFAKKGLSIQQLKKSQDWYQQAHQSGYVPSSLALLERCFLGIVVSQNFQQAQIIAEDILANPTATDEQKKQVDLYLAGVEINNGNYRQALQKLKISWQFLAVCLLLLAFIVYYFKNPKTRKKWSIWDLALIISIYIAGSLICQYLIFTVLIPLLGVGYLIGALACSGLVIVTIIMIFVILSRVRGDKFWSIVKHKKHPLHYYLIWQGLGFVAIITLTGTYAFITHFLKIPSQPQPLQQLILLENNPLTLIFIVIYGGLGVAIIEEFLFRGIVHKSLKYSPAIILTISAIFFGVAHLDIYNLVPLSLIGFVLAFSYYKSQTIIVPILIHATNNIFGFAVLLIMKSYS